MAIYFVKRDYKVELVTLTLECVECGLNLNTVAYSNQKQITHDCPVCGHMFEVKIIVCPECNSSVHVIVDESKAYWGRACEKRF